MQSDDGSSHHSPLLLPVVVDQTHHGANLHQWAIHDQGSHQLRQRIELEVVGHIVLLLVNQLEQLSDGETGQSSDDRSEDLVRLLRVDPVNQRDVRHRV